MGYEVHITRRQHWAGSDSGSAITLQEWKDYIASDPEMRLDGFAEATTPAGETIRLELDGMAVWTAYSEDGVGGNHAWIYHSGDCIEAKNPDEEILQKLHRIATMLGAKVQGDEGECYDSDGNMIEDDLDSMSGSEDNSPTPPLVPRESGPTRPWWKFW